MTTWTEHQGRIPVTVPVYTQPQRVTQARVLRSEWTKLRTQPSAGWALLSAVVLIIGFGILYSLLREARPPHGAEMKAFDAASVSLSGVQLAQIAVGVLGVLLITSEYASGLIRAGFAAVPRRLPILWGKAVLLVAATVAVSLPAVLVAFLAGQSILGRQHLAVSLGQPGVARAVLLSGLFLALFGLLGMGIGAIVRNTAAAISAYVGVTFLLPLLLQQLSGNPARYTPVQILANSVSATVPHHNQVSVTLGLLLMVAYTAAALIAGAVVFKSRDA